VLRGIGLDASKEDITIEELSTADKKKIESGTFNQIQTPVLKGTVVGKVQLPLFREIVEPGQTLSLANFPEQFLPIRI
jgi:hypothetical protein